MIDSLYIAVTGLQSEQSHIDAISNNLANLNTTAYKTSKVSFEDLMYKQPVSAADQFSLQSLGVQSGVGSSVSGIYKIFSSGDLKATENELDIAIRGAGFLEVELANGEVAYTRNGALQVSREGLLKTSDGYVLSDQIQVPPDTVELLIARNGVVEVRAAEDEQFYEIGQIQIANFFNSQGLKPLGSNIYFPTEESGEAYYSTGGENGVGEVQQGFLETSNVDLVSELMELMIAQRGYQVNSQVIQVSDEILRINNSLRR